MKTGHIFFITISCLFVACNANRAAKKTSDQTDKKEKTSFQTSGQWKPATDVRSDVAIVYGVNDRPDMTFEKRVQSWRDRGYITHFMTGIAWGGYADYFTGKWDGINHLGEGQVTVKGDTIWHGKMTPYLVPTASFIKYMNEKHVKRVIDAGIDAIFMEEPEFWARGGYSPAFKTEWQKYYGFPWRAQHESPENTYLSSKLKYHLYYNALNEVFTYAKAYGKTKGMNVRCYVPTHSLVNYSSWMIVSPEASLASLPCVDGYIAQVWTGTSREPTYFNGLKKERVFENAFLEYGSMESMTRPTGRKMFFLTDPIEDWPRDWVDYKKNYQATFSAKLLYPMVDNYEVMPWPDRIYEGLYKTSANSEVKEKIPRFYSTQMQVMVNSLNQMPLSENRVSGASGIAVAMANSLMFQRFPTHGSYTDPQLSNFYGLTLPLLKRGVPVSIVHLENVSYKATWKDVKVLVLSYSNLKPPTAEAHQHIADWVKGGGQLIYCGRDDDPFQTVQEWWNKDTFHYRSPSEHLFELLGLDKTAQGVYACGKGTVSIMRQDPKEFVLQANQDKGYIETVRQLYEEKSKAGKLVYKNNFLLSRGPYEIISVMDESVSDEPYTMKGKLIDLFDPTLPVLSQKQVQPDEQAYLYNIDKAPHPQTPQVLASACRIYDEKVEADGYSFTAKSPANTRNVMRILLPDKPQKITITDTDGIALSDTENSWEELGKTCFLAFENSPNGVNVVIKW